VLARGALDAVHPVRLESGASAGQQGSHVVECHVEGELHGSRVASALSQQVATVQSGDQASGESVGVGAGSSAVLADRAPIFAVIYLLSYSGATIPSLISGQLSNTFTLPQIVLGYGGLALIGTVFTLIAARNPHADTISRPMSNPGFAVPECPPARGPGGRPTTCTSA
jgi:hypothetical protein